MRRLLIVLWLLVPTLARANVVVIRDTTVTEGATAVFWVAFCSTAGGAATSPCTVGAPAAPSTLVYGVNDTATGHVLLADVTLTSPTTTTCTPTSGTAYTCIKLVIPASAGKIVGRCANASATTCTSTSDCTDSAACTVSPADRKQTHELTLEWTYTDSQGTCAAGSKSGYPCTVDGDCPSSTCTLTGTGTARVQFVDEALPFSPL